MTHRCLTAAGLAALALFATPAVHAARSYDNCTGFIDSVPATISTQGTWCLRKDLSTGLTSTAAVTINTNNVTIDCNDFKLGGLQAGAGTASRGIHAAQRQNITVRNCNLRGFHTGVHLQGGGHVVEDNRIEGMTYAGVDISGDGSLVRRNAIASTGGSTLLEYRWRAYGIIVGGTADVLDNTVDGVWPNGDDNGNGNAAGIYTHQNLGGTVGNNRVRNVLAKGESADEGIRSQDSGRAWITGNQITGSGRANSTAIRCDSTSAVAADNFGNGFAHSLAGCADGGGNYHP